MIPPDLQLELAPFPETDLSDNPLAGQLCLFLSSRPDWYSAARLACLLPSTDGQTLNLGDREIRAAAEAAKGQIISGQKGYKHIQHATPEEVSHFVNWMESQAKRMIARAQAARQTAHKLFG